MTNLPPSDPRSSQRSPLDFDEFIGVIVAFTTIGAILFWSFSRKDTGWDLSKLLPTPAPSAQPTPGANPNNLLPGLSNQTNPKLGIPVPVIPPVQPNKDTSIIVPSVDQPNQPPSSSVVVVPPAANTNPAPFQVTTPVAGLPVTPPPRAFTDVPDNFWAKRFIDVLSSRQIITGFKDYSFRPDQQITRAEFAAIVERAFNKDIGQTKLAFTDIPAGYWATGSINDAISTGFMKGYPDKSFKPEQKISRVEVLVSLVTGLNLKTQTAPERVIAVYQDAKDIPKYAINRVATASLEELVVNYPDRNLLAPNRPATRAEVAALIHQALVRTGRLPAIKSDNIVNIK